jgi:hypothetical protein
MIWLYAICDRPDLPPPPSRGLAQAPLDGLSEGGVQAIFTRHGNDPCEPAPDALWAHERVVERLMLDRAAVPMRFGSKVDDELSLRTLLAENQERFLQTLARVTGRVELGVRVLGRMLADPGDGTPQSVATATVVGSGRDYLLGKLQNANRIDHAAAELHTPLAAMSVETCRQPVRGDDEVLRSAYLVDQRIVGRFRGAVERLQLTHPDVAILCTGPWPAYSFVN